MSSKTVFIVGYCGFGNTGNEAILAVLLAQLRRQQPDLRIIVSSGNPEATASEHGVEAISWNRVGDTQRVIQAADLIVLGGGGLFHDYWGVDLNSLLTNRHWGLSYYTGVALLASIHGKPLVLHAVGVGPLISSHGARLVRAICEVAQCITVRDAGSREALVQAGVDRRKVIVTADPSFAFRVERAGQLHQTGTPPLPLHKPLAGVAVRSWSVGVHPDFFEDELAAALDLFLQQSGGSVVFFPFQDLGGSGGQEDDRAVAQRIQARMRLAARTALFQKNSTADDIYAAMRQCDVVVGMRLQSLTFAITNQVPLVVLSYDPKTEQLAGEFGLDEWMLHVSAIQSVTLARKIEAALERRAEFDKPLEPIRELKAQAAAESSRLTLEVLHHPKPPAEAGPETAALLTSGVLAQIAHGERLDAENRTLATQTATTSAALRQAQLSQSEQLRKVEEDGRASQQQIKSLEARNSALSTEIRNLREELRQASERGQNAQATRQVALALLNEVDRFREVSARELTTYRSQRAWQVMLFFRKAYTLLMKEPVSRWLPWLLKLPFGGVGRLEEYDLHFPDIANYIPDHARALLAAPPEVVDSGSLPKPLPPEVPPPKKYDIIILAIIDFDFRFQRPQQIAAEQARRGHRVFWVSPTRFLPPNSPQTYETKLLRDNLWEVHLRGPQPDIYMGALSDNYLQPLTASLQQFMWDWVVSENVVMAQLPFWRRLALALRASHGSKLLYDCMDDWETFPNIGAFNISEETLFSRECDVLVVTAAELRHKFQALGLNPVLARNGADYQFFASAGPTNLLDGIPHPIVGYFGAIADWIDLDLIYEVAKLRPNYSFVMIGQVFGRDVSQLQQLPNVFLLGNKRYEDIPYYLYHFDACTIPFLINQVTKATDPVKLYEYFSLGKPVVATAMAELQQCAELLYIGEDARQFAGHLDQAVSEKDPTLAERRIAFSQDNTWGRRVDSIDQAVVNSFPLVSILIVTHNSERFVRHCLDSIAKNTSYPNYEVIIEDNASTDTTVTLLKQYAAADARIKIIASPENLGFSGGNNLAAGKASGQYLIFLNIDTMVTPGWVSRLVQHVETDPTIGLICPVTNFAGNEAKINVSYAGPEEMIAFSQSLAAARHGQHTEIRVAPLYCALITRKVWNSVGALDTRYEVGMFEDDDYSLRIWDANYRVAMAEDCFIHHFGQGSFAKLASETYNKIFEKNRARFEEKWRRPWQPHKPRAGVRSALEDRRFTPETFH